MSHVERCLNCEERLATGAKFCPACGQKADTHRLTLGHFIHEVFHAFTHADKGILYLIKGLALYPGRVAKDYLAGKRKKYFNPFTFFLILMTGFVISNNFFDPETPEAQTVEQQFKDEPPGPEKEKKMAMVKRGKNIRTFYTKHGNVMAMIAVPFFALYFWGIYRRKKYNYAEHLTASVMFVGFANLAFTVVVFPLTSLAPDGPIKGMLTFLGLILQVAYFTWAYNSLMETKGFGQKTSVFFICLTGIILWTILSMTAFAIYIYQSWDFIDFFKRMATRR